MKIKIGKRLITLCVFGIVLSVGNAQGRASDKQLFTFIKVWGFLKYYHPAFASGRLDADSMFHLFTWNLSDTTSDRGFRLLLSDFVRELGPVGPAKAAKNSTLFRRNQDFKWTQNLDLIPVAVKRKLLKLKETGYTGTGHKYMPANFHETELPGEYQYPDHTETYVGARLISLARYWNAVEYLYPYKYTLQKWWDEVLMDQLPSFAGEMSPVDYETHLLQLNTAIGDSHGGSVAIKNKAAIYGSFFPPFHFRFVGDSIVVTDYIDTASCVRQDILPGDVIYKINNQPVSASAVDWIVSASNLEKKKAILSSPMLLMPLRGKDSIVGLGYQRGGRQMHLNLAMAKPSAKYVSTLTEIYRRETGNGSTTTNDFVLRSIDPGIAHLDAANLSIMYNTSTDERGIDSVLSLMRKHSRGIIIDMRCYATQAVFYNKLLSALGWRLKPFASLKAHSTRYPGAYYEKDIFSAVVQPKVQELYKGKVILLVDSRTHSQSELITMILQASGPAFVIGTQSSGADGDLIQFPVAGGYELTLSGRHVSYPDGTPSQHTGVKRDLKVKLTTSGVGAGRDEILEAALKLLQQ